MTAANNRCDICNREPMIGVASTSVPFSCAFCLECAQRGADPEFVFVFWAEDIPPDEHAAPDDCVTWKDGGYMTYREWYNKYKDSC